MPSIDGIVDYLLQGQLETAMGDIHSILTGQDEVNSIKEFSILVQEAARQEEINRSHIKDVLKAYMTMKESMESAIANDRSTDALGEEINQLKTQHQKALQTSEDAKQQCQALKEESDQMHAKQEQLSQKREVVKEDTTQVLPKTRYNVSLYSCITGIKWDYDCKPDEIKGYVSTSKDVRPFSLDRKQHSKFFTTNYLWDLVEAAMEAK
ncbi:kinetochore protein spc24-like [Lytechinus pictus]|uniref:kinetochore protein spc24-like n=1 Tax=Lytechinus pictus TaxID=7653 RepID=UPI0030B9F490